MSLLALSVTLMDWSWISPRRLGNWLFKTSRCVVGVSCIFYVFHEIAMDHNLNASLRNVGHPPASWDANHSREQWLGVGRSADVSIDGGVLQHSVPSYSLPGAMYSVPACATYPRVSVAMGWWCFQDETFYMSATSLFLCFTVRIWRGLNRNVRS